MLLSFFGGVYLILPLYLVRKSKFCKQNQNGTYLTRHIVSQSFTCLVIHFHSHHGMSTQNHESWYSLNSVSYHLIHFTKPQIPWTLGDINVFTGPIS